MYYVRWDNRCPVDTLVGMVLVEVKGEKGEDRMLFVTEDGRKFLMYHSQECCEYVSIEDICGDLADLVGQPILVAEESTSGENPEGVPVGEYQDSFTWTFYRLATAKGWVTIRWYGESNGYYGESVDFGEVKS